MRFVRARAFVFFSLTGAVGAAELIAPPDLPGLNGEEGITKWVVQGKVIFLFQPTQKFDSAGMDALHNSGREQSDLYQI